MLARQESDKEPAAGLVEGGEEAVDVAVGACDLAAGVAAAVWTGAPVQGPRRSELRHDSLLPDERLDGELRLL